jgi:hypothetical protein
MKVFLTSAYGDDHTSRWLLSNAPYASTISTSNPEEADVIIFAENHPGHDPYFRDVLKSSIYKKYRHKCVLYHDADRSITPIPTLSPSIEAWQYNKKHKRIAHYVARLCENDTVNNARLDFSSERTYLYNFIGSRTHPIRGQIFAMRHPAETYIKDTTGSRAWELTKEQKETYELEYFHIMQSSYFVLAPRGVGPCTYRLFETLQLGRVPVIIADAWLRVPNVNWDEFSITVPEEKIHQIPSILRERREEAVEMGKLARKRWEEHFSPEVSLRHLAKAAGELIQSRYNFVDSVRDHSQFLQKPWHLKNYVRARLKRILRVERLLPK